MESLGDILRNKGHPSLHLRISGNVENGERWKVLIHGKVGDSPIYKMSVPEEIRGRQFR